MTPAEYYHKQLESGEVLHDSQQAFVIDKLQAIYTQLTQQNATQQNFLQKLQAVVHKPKPIKGLYLWGNVGAGKTFLMNLFYHCLPFENKLRLHFHQFMEQVHQQLRIFQGKRNPLVTIANDFANKYKVICFDEMIVEDIADAMLLAGLFKELFANNVCFIITSNTMPDNLYYHGLQRERFLPAIALINKYCDVLHINIEKDYRLDYIKHANYYHSPLTSAAYADLEKYFLEFSNNTKPDSEPIEIYGRKLHIKKQADGVIWFDFINLCGIPRSQRDYLAIAKDYHTVILSGLSAMAPNQTDLVRSFVKMVDVFYDAKMRLIIAAAQPIDRLYTEGQLLTEFFRTRSRLKQMQSTDWVLAPRLSKQPTA